METKGKRVSYRMFMLLWTILCFGPWEDINCVKTEIFPSSAVGIVTGAGGNEGALYFFWWGIAGFL